MKLLTFKFYIACWLYFTMSFLYSKDNLKIENIIIHENPVKLEKIMFKSIDDLEVNLIKFDNKLVVLNFWATWCLPCREEMPYLDQLSVNKKLSNIKIFAVNVGRDDREKQKKFFSELNIKNLKIYFDSSGDLPRKFMLRGLPTTVFINKNGEEFARIIGSYKFDDKKFVKWLENYN